MRTVLYQDNGKVMYQDNGEGTTTAIVVGGKLRVQTAYGNGCERVEEWVSDNTSMKGGDLTLQSRRWRMPSKLNLEPDWEYEIGAPKPKASPSSETTFSISTSLNPVWSASMTQTHFVFSVTNAPWPVDNYTVTAAEGNEELILRTKNKKFYKRWRIPSLVRAGEKIDEVS